MQHHRLECRRFHPQRHPHLHLQHSLSRRRLLNRDHFRSEEHTSELQSLRHLVCRFLLDAATTEIYTLSLHDALPICRRFHPQRHPHLHLQHSLSRRRLLNRDHFRRPPPDVHFHRQGRSEERRVG